MRSIAADISSLENKKAAVEVRETKTSFEYPIIDNTTQNWMTLKILPFLRKLGHIYI